MHAHQPDCVHLQEVPNGGAGFHVDQYRAVDATVVSHCEHIVTYIRMESEEALFGPCDRFVKLQLPEQAGSEFGFGLALQLNLEEPAFLVNVHLEPFKEGAITRHEQLSLMSSRLGHKAAVLIAGDTNTRKPELKSLSKAPLNVTPIKVPQGMPDAPSTWDSFSNRFRGEQTFPFRAAFSRFLSRSGSASAGNAIVSFAVVPGELSRGILLFESPILSTKHAFHLSDHFGFLADISILQSM
ncbi:hypothetical protein FVE85_8684 [Porphyridium purpureum]|uniref:Endonuclease/exonuclease/phosphatase domain-containing protein n=1 Tax=Porphyridium purpureum TaxID=35688 RepID=A0A5J4YP76_PORPP|nr:hypothetical protein FVE85_8684 [Porphyridium purpureum]|eukprot:POR7145..scf296_7